MACTIGCSQYLGHAEVLPQNTGEAMDGHTVSEVIPGYLHDMKARHVFGREHARCARSTLYKFAEHAGQRRLKNIGLSVIESWVAKMEHLAPSTIRQRISTVRTFFRWCIRRNHLRRNPCDELDRVAQPRTVPRALAEDAIAKVLGACPDTRARFIILLTAQQGLRCIEISRLTLGDLDLNHRTMMVIGKGHHERVLPIMEETLDALYDYLGDHPASAGPLVRSYNQCHRSLTAAAISTLVAGWMKDAGIKRQALDGVSAHAGRHSCATHMLLRGAHLRDVQAVLGHRHLSTTERYLPLIVHGLEAAMEGRTYRTNINGP